MLRACENTTDDVPNKPSSLVNTVSLCCKSCSPHVNEVFHKKKKFIEKPTCTLLLQSNQKKEGQWGPSCFPSSNKHLMCPDYISFPVNLICLLMIGPTTYI